jgi:5-methylcytosine-specific restriction enzyme subunit McrC
MAVLAVREYERITTGESFSPTLRAVTARQRERLERFNERFPARGAKKPFAYAARNSLLAQNFVGVIDLGDHQVEVLPKIEGADTSTIRHNLARMIAASVGLQLHDGGASLIKDRSSTVLEILMRLFCERLWRELHAGLMRRYEWRADDLGAMRGKLNVARQVTANAGRPHVLACVYEEFSADNHCNQLLKCALSVLKNLARSAELSSRIETLLFCFDEVSDRPSSAFYGRGFVTDRLSTRFEPLIRLAEMFVREQSPDVVSGAGHGFALLFDMNVLFEQYVGHELRRMFSGTATSVRLQQSGTFLARTSENRSVFELVPDVVACTEDRVTWIADTKWKRLDPIKTREGVSSADMYQMHAYSRRYACPRVVLLYPHHPGLGTWRSCRHEYQIEGGDPAVVHVATVDLARLDNTRAQLRQIFCSFSSASA